jgi:hypothetical protein
MQFINFIKNKNSTSLERWRNYYEKRKGLILLESNRRNLSLTYLIGLEVAELTEEDMPMPIDKQS